ncbi:hypothetical protein BC829DRAFT_400661 [Chytridium lagenaria]|nr:hypothetical protein BC829DRAFT_400661 [Chytridium lagenaria]
MSCCGGSRKKVAVVQPQTTYVEEIKVDQPTKQPPPEPPTTAGSKSVPPTPSEPSRDPYTFVAHSMTALDEEVENEIVDPNPSAPQKSPDTDPRPKTATIPPPVEEDTRKNLKTSQSTRKKQSSNQPNEITLTFDDDEDEGVDSRPTLPQDDERPEDEEEEEEDDAGPPRVVNAFGADTVPKTPKPKTSWFGSKDRPKATPIQSYRATSMEKVDPRKGGKGKAPPPLAKEATESSLEPTDEAIVEGVAPPGRIYASTGSLNGKVVSPAHPFGFIDDA